MPNKGGSNGHLASGVHFTTGNDCCSSGDRVPALWFNEDGTLHISITVNGKIIAYNTMDPVQLNTWTKIEISQALEGRDYMYRVAVNGWQIRPYNNTEPREFTNVHVYAADPW